MQNAQIVASFTPDICWIYSVSEESVRGNETGIGAAVQLFAFSKPELHSSSDTNEFEGKHFPEPYLPNNQ